MTLEQLEANNAQLLFRVEQLQQDLRDLRNENATLQSTTQLQAREIEQLTALVERDRRRVEAETAIEARKIALATRQAVQLQSGDGLS